MPDRIVVAGPVRVAWAISWTGCVSVDVKYSVSRLTTCASTRPITTARKARQPGPKSPQPMLLSWPT